MQLPPPQIRRGIARAAGMTEQYLYQCLTGRKSMSAANAVQIERLSQGVLKRWHVRPRDWHKVWPELVGSTDAPATPDQEPQ